MQAQPAAGNVQFSDAFRTLVESYPGWLSVLGGVLVALLTAAWFTGRWFISERIGVLEDRLKSKDEEIARLKTAATAHGTSISNLAGGLSDEQMAQMRTVLSTRRGKVLLSYQASSPVASAVTGQLETILDGCSWDVVGSQILVNDEGQDRLLLLRGEQADAEDYSAIRMALTTARVPFVEADKLAAVIEMGWSGTDRPQLFVRGGLRPEGG